MTTLQPRAPYSQIELERLYPKELELRQVQVLLRHGERTPVNARFQNAGLPPYWPYCSAANTLKASILSADASWDTLQWKRRLEHFGEQDTPVLSAGKNGEVDAICQPGELTDRGRETTLALGQRIRRLYVEQLGFLPGTLDHATSAGLHIRSTPVPRALESVQQAFTGLYPPAHRVPNLAPPVVVTRSWSDETLFPNDGACKRFAELSRAFANRTALAWNESPQMAYINKKVGKWMPEHSGQAQKVAVDSHPRLSGVMDTVNATLAHRADTKLPSEFYDKQLLRNIDKICTEEWFAGYAESDEYRRLGIGSLIGDIVQRMVQKVDYAPTSVTDAGQRLSSKGGDVRLSLAGCHDTTLASVLASLGAFDPLTDRWPFFTSSIAFELFHHKSAVSTTSPSGTAVWPSKEKSWWYRLFSPSRETNATRSAYHDLSSTEQIKMDGFYVRLRYNDKPMTLPFCRSNGKHFQDDESLCTLAAFKQAADAVTPSDWKKECGMNLGSLAFPNAKQPPPGLENTVIP